MVSGDLYILKFNFDFRKSQKFTNSFKYNTDFGGAGDIIFMRNCQTIILRVGSTNLAIRSPGTSNINGRI